MSIFNQMNHDIAEVLIRESIQNGYRAVGINIDNACRNDNCHGDEHLKPEISETQKRALINEIKQSLLKDPDVRADISVDVYKDEKFMVLINLVSDCLDAANESVFDLCEIGRMFVNLVNERYYKLAVKESGNE